jgi:hypothetical protein
MFDESAGDWAWNSSDAVEWWDLHMPDVDRRDELERLQDLSPEEILQIG